MRTNKELTFEIRNGRLYVGYKFAKSRSYCIYDCEAAVEVGAECMGLMLRLLSAGGEYSVPICPDDGRGAAEGLEQCGVSLGAKKHLFPGGKEDKEVIGHPIFQAGDAPDGGDVGDGEDDRPSFEGAGGDEAGMFHDAAEASGVRGG